MSEPSDRRLVDDAADAYVDWREEASHVWNAYEGWQCARLGDGHLAFAAYLAALEREERASQVYTSLVMEITTKTSDVAGMVVTA